MLTVRQWQCSNIFFQSSILSIRSLFLSHISFNHVINDFVITSFQLVYSIEFVLVPTKRTFFVITIFVKMIDIFPLIFEHLANDTYFKRQRFFKTNCLGHKTLQSCIVLCQFILFLYELPKHTRLKAKQNENVDSILRCRSFFFLNKPLFQIKLYKNDTRDGHSTV